MHQPVSLIVALLLMLLLAKVLGEFCERIKQPAMIGELIAGFILGPSLLNFIVPGSELKIISELGVFFLILLAGMEVDLEKLKHSISGKNIWIALMAFIVPAASGLLISLFFNLDKMIVIFISLCISITALPVSIRILMDLGKLNTPIGQKIVSAAIFNDVIALLILGVLLEFNKFSNFENQSYFDLSIDISIIILKIILFITIIIFIYILIQRAKKNFIAISNKINAVIFFLKSKESAYAMYIMIVLGFATLAELLGLHFVIGAFFGAASLHREIFKQETFNHIHQTTHGITMGFLAPIFFAYMGLEFNFSSLNNIALIITILFISFISKIIGGLAGGKMAGLSNGAAITLGFGLNARGLMELVIANIALQKGIINVGLFSILVMMGLVTTLLSPLLLKYGFKNLVK